MVRTCPPCPVQSSKAGGRPSPLGEAGPHHPGGRDGEVEVGGGDRGSRRDGYREHARHAQMVPRRVDRNSTASCE